MRLGSAILFDVLARRVPPGILADAVQDGPLSGHALDELDEVRAAELLDQWVHDARREPVASVIVFDENFSPRSPAISTMTLYM
jgi:hypothetical protein